MGTREEKLLTAPISSVGHLVLVGSVGLSAGLRSAACRRGIEVTFLSRRGGWQGRLDHATSTHPQRLRRQLEFADNPDRWLPIVAEMLFGKIANQRALLMRYARRHGAATIADSAEKLRRLAIDTRGADSPERIRGLEGAAARTYFHALGALVPGVGFTGRHRRPPTDIVNAALGYGYAVALSEVTGALVAAGLDPNFGMLHRDRIDAPALALDAIEEFRPLLVDSVVVKLIRKGSLTRAHGRSEKGRNGVLLNAEGKRRLINAYDQRLRTAFGYSPSSKKVTYRRALLLQARRLAAVVDHDDQHYRAVAWR